MARRGFFRRIIDAVQRVAERFTEPEPPKRPKPRTPGAKRPRETRRQRRVRPVDDFVPTPLPEPDFAVVGPDWDASWGELDPLLIDEVISDLLTDLDNKGYF